MDLAALLGHRQRRVRLTVFDRRIVAVSIIGSFITLAGTAVLMRELPRLWRA